MWDSSQKDENTVKETELLRIQTKGQVMER